MKNFFGRLSDFTLTSLLDVYIKHYKRITLIVTALLLGIILFLGWMSARSVRNVVVDEFNQQQLVLARHAASQIENSLNVLKREISLLGLSPSIQYYEFIWMVGRMRITFSTIKDEGCLEIRFIDNKNMKAHIMGDHGYSTGNLSSEEIDYLEWAKKENNKGNILISDIVHMDYGNHQKKLIMKLISPVWQVSIDDAHPIAQNKFSGALIFFVDAAALTGKVAKGIQSGKTGYAWVIDRKGTFLYHYVSDFIGKNAFEARKGRGPSISFTRINEIQKEKMLKGEEGTSWYISGWHRGQEGEIKKLIAYAPIHLSKEPRNLIWSVGVVAPISEVEGAIRGIQVRQVLLEIVGIFGVLCGGLFIMGLMLRWSSSLKQEVEEKTKELRKSEEQYRFLVEHAGDIIFTVNKEDKLSSMNRYGYNFFRKRPEEILGCNIIELFPDECAELHLEKIKEVFNANVSTQLTCPVEVDGNKYWLSTNYNGLLDEKGNVFSVLGIARDITERKKIEEQMYHTEKMASVGTMAAGVAHEINNPLAIILGFTDLLLEKLPQDSEPYDLLKTIEKQGLHAKRIVGNLLSFARIKEYKEEEVDINENIETVLAVEANNLKLNNIVVQKNMVESLPKVRGHIGELQQVFFNIINNSIAAMKGGGVLTITTKAIDEGENVEIRISDTGSGIKKEYRAKIFDPFFTTKRVGEGTGLGLSITYSIVNKQGGSITFETKTKEESVETGTTFIIILPAITQ
jgi:PAS domain S-box-containing protein